MIIILAYNRQNLYDRFFCKNIKKTYLNERNNKNSVKIKLKEITNIINYSNNKHEINDYISNFDQSLFTNRNEIYENIILFQMFFVSEYFYDIALKGKVDVRLDSVDEIVLKSEENFRFPNNFNLPKTIQYLMNSSNYDPRFVMNDLHKFYVILKNLKMEFSTVSLSKYFSQVKMESCFLMKEKDINSFQLLSEISNFFKLSIMEKVNLEFTKLLIKTKTINDALIDTINFNFCKQENIYDIFKQEFKLYAEANNYLDIFIHEADLIGLKNEVVTIAKYIQYIKNNQVRFLFYKIYEQLLRKDNILTYVDSSTPDFDAIFNTYMGISFDVPEYDKIFKDDHIAEIKSSIKSNCEKLRIVEEIVLKDFCLHPMYLDYIKISLYCGIDRLVDSLKYINSNYNDDDSYALGNIINRVNFFLSMCKFLLL